jgi:hypothetical protein
MEPQQIKKEFSGEEVVQQLRLLFKNIGVERPCEDTLKGIKELVEKDGNNLITFQELRKVLENAVSTLDKSEL